MALKVAQFTTASSKGQVYLSLGFVPDFVMALLNITGTNPNMFYWCNPATITSFPAQLITMLGSSGVFTIDTDAVDIVTAYAGGEREGQDFSGETANSATKHVDHTGALIGSGLYTPAGIYITDEYQTNSGINIVVAFRNE